MLLVLHSPDMARAARRLELLALLAILCARTVSAGWGSAAVQYGPGGWPGPHEARSQGSCGGDPSGPGHLASAEACTSKSTCVWDGTSCSVDPAAPAYAQAVRLTDAARAPADGGTNAKCLDGSAPLYYIKRGSGTGANKWYIHHEGGGWCVGPEGCALRAGFLQQTGAPAAGMPQLYQGMGSTELLADTTELDGGYFSSDPAINPMMHNWNMVQLKYVKEPAKPRISS